MPVMFSPHLSVTASLIRRISFPWSLPKVSRLARPRPLVDSPCAGARSSSAFQLVSTFPSLLGRSFGLLSVKRSANLPAVVAVAVVVVDVPRPCRSDGGMIANAYAFALSPLVVRGRRLARRTTPRFMLPLLLPSPLQASSLVTLCTHGLLASAYE